MFRTRCGAEREVRVERGAWEWLVPLTPDWSSFRPIVAEEPPVPVIVRNTVRTFRRTRRVVVNVWGDVLPLFVEES